MKVAIIFVLVALTAVLARDPLCPDQEETEAALIYPHESDETRFYICGTNGTLIEFQCTEGLAFDAEVKVCNWPMLINKNRESAQE
ncbi:hypothetical protein Bhyg_07226 [Pseudolycoriella hygida]|uniref:Chitin-binding type-2 domain-containing protein n=1 Tax=Pseudolycoriella hygida TaxID=35572 RepID=A0A9Q0N460_9DIPT|nr:hypothetical protein Bhyg_07226 [Pseudolycoriella hygida]